MIKTLIFDFGDVFINLDKTGAMQHALNLFGIDSFSAEMMENNMSYEKGLITTPQFLDFYQSLHPNIQQSDIIGAWNYIIKDFPEHRLKWLTALAQQKKYDLMLLSNTNTLHIDYIKEHVSFYETFKEQFNAFYLSHEIHMRKPDTNIFEFVLTEHNISPETCLFIDDTKENTDTAKQLGFHIWNIDEASEDVVTLFDTYQELF